MMVLFFMHILFVMNHTINATPPERLQHPLLFTTNHTDRTFFVWRLNSARPSHPGHSTTLLRSEIPSDICAKLRTVAASNNRDHACNLSYYCLLALQTWWCYSSRTSRSWWITQSMQHHQRGCNTAMVLHRALNCVMQLWTTFVWKQSCTFLRDHTMILRTQKLVSYWHKNFIFCSVKPIRI